MASLGEQVRSRRASSSFRASETNVFISSTPLTTQVQGQMGLAYITPFGALKADFLSMGLVQTSFEGFSPLPFMQLNTQVCMLSYVRGIG